MIIRAPRTTSFTVIPNDILNDRDIPADSLGLLAYLLSKPDNWEIQSTHLCNRFNCGRDRVYRMLRDLRQCSYADFERAADGSTTWIISETRTTQPYAENTDKDKKPHPEKPHLEKPDLGFPHDIVSTERAVNTETSFNTEKSYRSTASLFDRWWDAYPKKVGKKTAKSIWQRRKLDTLADTIIHDTVTRSAVCQKWADGFIPNPTTYLNGDRWEDEIQSDSRRETHTDRQLRIIRSAT